MNSDLLAVSSPRIYGLPKVYKPEVLLRPIVSCNGSLTYQLSKYITSNTSSLASKTDSFVKKSRYFVKMMRDVCIEKDEMLVSFDVSCLFTNVPVGENVKVIHKQLQQDKTIGRQDGPLLRQNSGTT